MSKTQKIKLSNCCNYEVRYNGFVGLIDYGWTCNRCDRKCKTYEKEVHEHRR